MIQTKISSLKEYVDLIHSHSANFDKTPFVFRGQSNIKWDVESGAYRRLNNILDNISIITYQNRLIYQAKKRINSYHSIHDLSDLSALAEMQHYGAATMLIDFTFNPLIALFFACYSNYNKNGAVFCYEWVNAIQLTNECENLTQDMLLNKYFDHNILWNPQHSNERIIKQDSVFLFNSDGWINRKDFSKIFCIDKTKKKDIIKDLRCLYGIDMETVYPDFIGFVNANSSSEPLPDNWLEILDVIFERSKEKKIVLLKQAINKTPYNDSAWIDLGEIYLGDKNVSKAISCFSNALSNNSLNDTAIFRIGKIWRENNYIDFAIDNYLKAIEIKPQSIDYMKEISDIYDSMGNMDKAIDIISKIVKQESSSDNLALLGRMFYKLGCQDDMNKSMIFNAIESFNKALKLDPENIDYFRDLGDCYSSIESYSQAIDYYSKVCESSKDSSDYFNLGFVYYCVKEFEKAMPYLLKSYNSDKSDLAVIVLLGVVYTNMKKFRSAKYYLNRALNIDKANKNALFSLGLLCMDFSVKDYSRAVKIYEEYLSHYPDDIDALYNLGYSYCKIGNIDKSYKIMHYITNIAEDKHDSLNYLGYIYLLKKEYVCATYYVKKAMKIKDDPYVVMNLGHCFYLQNKNEYLEHYIQSYIEIEDKNEFWEIMEHEHRELLKSSYNDLKYLKLKQKIMQSIIA